MLVTGHQLRAARSLAGIEQKALAALAGISSNTLHKMEAAGAAPIEGRLATIRKVQGALEAQGIEFVQAPDGALGVMLRPKVKGRKK